MRTETNTIGTWNFEFPDLSLKESHKRIIEALRLTNVLAGRNWHVNNTALSFQFLMTSLEQAKDPERTVVDFDGNQLKTGTGHGEPLVLVNIHDIVGLKEWLRSAEV